MKIKESWKTKSIRLKLLYILKLLTSLVLVANIVLTWTGIYTFEMSEHVNFLILSIVFIFLGLEMYEKGESSAIWSFSGSIIIIVGVIVKLLRG